ncbi:hypothetical protein JW968_06350 [Candidatus Woesearchaeota archaeon]|nr:hypothetical protein [Candidatus Woesearchaeota archaeon]
MKSKLGSKRVEQLKKMPIIQNRVFKSQDGRFLVHTTSITHIKPVEYYEKVLDSEPDEAEDFF